MATKEAARPTITAEEVIKLGDHFGIDSIYTARDIFLASEAEYLSRDPQWTTWANCRALSNVFEAGRILGIRQERCRRAKQEQA